MQYVAPGQIRAWIITLQHSDSTRCNQFVRKRLRCAQWIAFANEVQADQMRDSLTVRF
jgi:hypothetical protein